MENGRPLGVRQRRSSGIRKVEEEVRRNILFVDDEREILQGLRVALRSQRNCWEMVFALGGQEAQAEMAKRSFDVILTDMRMPGMDGAALLAWAKEHQPRAARIVLSGQTDRESAMRTAFSAHQFLAKPCEVASLRAVIERTCRLTALVQDESLRTLAGDLATLPPAPEIFLALTRLLADPRSAVADAAKLGERDLALSSKILQVVNSAFFGLPRRVTSVREAATLMGTLTLKNLALALEATKPSKGRHLPEADLKALRCHSLHTAIVARHIARAVRSNSEDAFVAGMLHDVGVLVAAGEPSRLSSHAHLGAYLIGLWGLPHPVVEAVADHHGPWPEDWLASSTAEPRQVVAWADRLTKPYYPGHGFDDGGADHDQEFRSDELAFVERICPGGLDEWKAFAESSLHEASQAFN